MISLTTISIVVLAGYGILQALILFLTDRILLTHAGDSRTYKKHRPAWIVPSLFLSLVPPGGTFVPSARVSAALTGVGNVFLGCDLFYGAILLLGLIAYGVFRLFSRKRQGTGATFPFFLLLSALAAAVLFPVYGFLHAQRPVTNYFQADLHTSENRPAGSDYRIVLIADLHLSVNSFPALTERMVEQVNQTNPDLILIGGDVFTSSYAGLRSPEIYAAKLRKLQAKDGVYAVYGNHDVEERLFAGFAIHDSSYALRSAGITQFFEDCGFSVLEDETVNIADGALQLVGRLDLNKPGDGTKERMSAEDLLAGLDPDKPILVLEHEPADYASLQKAGADLVMSGHTHNGQIAPGNLLVKLFNENGYGYRDIAGMATFVTSGVGYFGPPMRIGTDSEVMVIDVRY